MSTFLSRLRRRPVLLLAVLLSAAGLAWSQQPAPAEGDDDPPGRVAHVTQREGGVVFSPGGEEEWEDLPANRPLTAGDRLWNDAGGRAELHLGTATLHLGGESHLGLSALDERAAQMILLQGSVNARVRELAPGENFEIDTPHLAFRAREPGDYRVDVDPQGGWTRVTVRSGTAVVYGEGGQAVDLGAGQASAFGGRFLAPVQVASTTHDALDQWAAARNLQEDRSVSARHVPRGVVGYPQLDAHGTWTQDATYGTVWVPRVATADWAPYRHGAWTWISPWGWTWVDDAPWGFAPFHYGRWALIGTQWAWVPGSLAPRPLYAPALVSFFGDPGGSVALQVGGPAVGWYPLGPGEAWWPTYRATPVYLGGVNRFIDLRRWPRNGWDRHMHRHHVQAITSVRMDDFRRGRPVRDAWRPVHLSQLGQWQPGVVPQRPDRGSPGFGGRGWSDRPGGRVVGTDRARIGEPQRRPERGQWEQIRRERQGGFGAAGQPPFGAAGQPPLRNGQPGAPWQRPQQQAVPLGGDDDGRRWSREREQRSGPRGEEGRGPRGEDARGWRGSDDGARRAHEEASRRAQDEARRAQDDAVRRQREVEWRQRVEVEQRQRAEVESRQRAEVAARQREEAAGRQRAQQEARQRMQDQARQIQQDAERYQRQELQRQHEADRRLGRGGMQSDAESRGIQSRGPWQRGQ